MKSKEITKDEIKRITKIIHLLEAEERLAKHLCRFYGYKPNKNNDIRKMIILLKLIKRLYYFKKKKSSPRSPQKKKKA